MIVTCILCSMSKTVEDDVRPGRLSSTIFANECRVSTTSATTGIVLPHTCRCGFDVLDIDSSSVYTAVMVKRTMQEATFLILTALAAGSQHGYGIITDVARISDGRVRLRAGTLYAALDRLRLDGLISFDREEIVENRLRRYYRLTPEGSRQLAAEAARYRSNAATAFARLGLTGGVAT
jgi:DNA-binding PadR family transcriptional regulator